MFAMTVLDYDSFVNENISIKPVTKTRLNGAGVPAAKYPDVRSIDEVIYNIRIAGFSTECVKDFPKMVSDCYSRFNSWNKLNMGERMLKHKQRSQMKNLSKSKVFATLYAAFSRFANNPEYKDVLDGYINRVKEDFFLDDKGIYDIYFKEPKY